MSTVTGEMRVTGSRALVSEMATLATVIAALIISAAANAAPTIYQDVVSVPDVNGNGKPELAALRRDADGQVIIVIKDSLSKRTLSNIKTGTGWSPRGIDVLDDLNGNGSAEIALLAVREDTGVTSVRVWDTKTTRKLTQYQVYFPKQNDASATPGGSTINPAIIDVIEQRLDDLTSAIGVLNMPPAVNVGPDRTTEVSQPLFLDAAASDDGILEPLVFHWSAPGAPLGLVSFGSPDAEDTTATFSEPGSYDLSLEVFDGFLRVADQLRVTVLACADGVQNGDEADIDCGGSCDVCDSGFACNTDSDCATGVCSGNICQVPSCGDGVKNGDETDIDCGGSCGACIAGFGCVANSDCVSGVCLTNFCAVPSCSDGVRNGDETGIDCGGSCGPCL
jgi:hypothetical protein